MINCYVENFDFGKLFEDVFSATKNYLNLPDQFDADISVVCEKEIKDLNNQYREKNEVTDVLSFPNVDFCLPFNKSDYEDDIDPDTDNIMLGDIIICEERMKKQAKEFNHSEKRELAFLALHGMLHLFGFDHIEEGDRVKMRAAEDAILENLKITRDN